MTTKNGTTEYQKLEAAIGTTTDLAQMIANYKLAIFHEKQFGLLKDLARAKAEGLFLDFRGKTGKESFAHPLGSCGYTEPKKKQLNKVRWEKAVQENEHLSRIQAEYNLALAMLEAAQEAYMELPGPKFYAK